MKMPKELFCKIVTDARCVDAPWLAAEASLENAVGDDVGPLSVGVYRLVEIKRVRRTLEVIGKGR
jgi:hypothetical protein